MIPVLKEERVMKKLLYLFLFVYANFLTGFLDQPQQKNNYHLRQTNDTHNHYAQHEQNIACSNDEQNTSQVFNHLKRRYPRKSNFTQVEDDPYGYAPHRQKQRKAYRH